MSAGSGIQSDGTWRPAFPGQRPPLQPGHEVTVTHGTYSPRKVEPIAAELVAALLADDAVAFLRESAYRPALEAWGRAEARCRLLEAYLGGDVGDLEADRVTAAYRELHRAETRANTLRTQLGLTPLARAKLGKDVAQGRAADAAAMMAELHRLEAEGKVIPGNAAHAQGEGSGQ